MVIVGFLGMVVFGLLIVAYIVWLMNVGLFGPREKNNCTTKSNQNNESFSQQNIASKKAPISEMSPEPTFEDLTDHERLALASFQVKDFSKAIYYFQESPRTAKNLYMLGICYLCVDDYDKAIETQDELDEDNYYDLLGEEIDHYLDCDDEEYSYPHGCGNRKSDGTNKGSKQEPSSKETLKAFYHVLDLPLDAQLEQVKSAYRTLVKVWHPDRFSHDPQLQVMAEQKMKAINEAYQILCKQ